MVALGGGFGGNVENASPKIRHQLMILSGSRKTRVLGWPRDWRPGEVVVADGRPMNLEEAWELIHATLEDDAYEVSEVELDEPPGKKGFVIIRQIEMSRTRLYIKLELGSGVVIGRSFHLSIYG